MTEEASKTKLRKQKANLSYRVVIIIDSLKETLDTNNPYSKELSQRIFVSLAFDVGNVAAIVQGE